MRIGRITVGTAMGVIGVFLILLARSGLDAEYIANVPTSGVGAALVVVGGALVAADLARVARRGP